MTDGFCRFQSFPESRYGGENGNATVRPWRRREHPTIALWISRRVTTSPINESESQNIFFRNFLFFFFCSTKPLVRLKDWSRGALMASAFPTNYRSWFAYQTEGFFYYFLVLSSDQEVYLSGTGRDPPRLLFCSHTLPLNMGLLAVLHARPARMDRTAVKTVRLIVTSMYRS